MNGCPAKTPSFPPPNAAVGGGGGMQKMSEVEINFMGIVAVAERLAMYAHPSGHKNHDQFVRLCLALARGIDYGVAKNEVPGHASILPPYLKQVCCRKNEFALQAAIMVLMISVKNACKMGWFTAKDTEELLTLACEIANSFGTINELTDGATDFMPIVSSVMSRFYPQLKLGHVIASLEVKPGYGTYLADFHISKNMMHSQEDNIRLFVAMKDDIASSSCIINPQQVNFLLNGRGVKYRTNVFMDQGPQLPTVVNSLLKYGTNLLQAVGQSNGHYVVLIAFVSVIPPDALLIPQDYLQHDAGSLSSDSEVIEGSSRICLNCPISFQRIGTPVKGYLCKHYQVNLKQRPSWRCPHCSQSVCFTDLRVDQNMVKILREVGENVTEVIISVDGLWTTVSSNNCKNKSQDKIPANMQKGNEPPDRAVNGYPSEKIYDLTEEDNGMDTADTCEQPDVKPVFDPNFQGVSVPINSSLPPVARFTNEFSRCSSTHVGIDPSSGVSLSESGAAGYPARSEAQLGGASVALTANPGVSPSTEAVSLLNRQPDNLQGNNYPMSPMMISQFSASGDLQLQDILQSIMSNDSGRAPLISGYVNKIQALSGQMPTLSPPQLFRLTPSPQQQFRPTPNPQQHFRQTPSPQQHPRPTPSPQQLFRPTPSFQQHSTPTLSPQQHFRPTSSPQQRFTPTPSPQQHSRPTPNPQHFRSTPSPLQHSRPTPSPQQHSRPTAIIPGANGSSLPPQMPLISHPVGSNFETPRQFQQSCINPDNVSHITSALLQNRSTAQQVMCHSAGSHGLNFQMPQTLSQPAPHLSRFQFHRNDYHQVPGNVNLQAGSGGMLTMGNAPGTVQPVQLVAPQPAQMRQPQHSPLQSTQSMRTSSSLAPNSGRMPQAVSRTENLINLQSEHNWRPGARMRGGLIGQAYSNLLDELMAQVPRPTQAPTANPRPTMSASAPHHALLANRMNAHAQPHNQPFMDNNARNITGNATNQPEAPGGEIKWA